MKRIYLIYILCCLTTISATAQGDRLLRTAKQLEIFNSLYRQLELNYVDTLNAEKHIGEAIDYMLGQIDPYTQYYPASKSDDLKVLSTGKYAGIGSPIVFRPDLDCAVFSDPYMDMPAYQSGVRSGDRIRMIDGESAAGNHPADYQKFLSSITDRLRGEPGTTVTVQIERPIMHTPGSSDSVLVRTISIVRQQIRRPNITLAQMLDETVGYIYLTGYTDNASSELRTAILGLKSKGMKQLVLDLRGNGGGLLQEAVKIVGLFVKRGTEVVSMRGRSAHSTEEYSTREDPLDRKMPLVILTDYGTASAAEITSGALQDMDRAVIVGNRTYGKGLVQQSLELPYDGALKYTIAKYYIPSGRCIQALDYSNRGEDGQPKHLADSLCKTFYTAAGRAVRDGGGITPDVTVMQDTLPSLIGYLRLSTQLFDWGVCYQNSHSTIAPIREFRLSPDEMGDFKEYLRTHGFKYDNQSKKKLSELRNWAKIEGFEADSSELFDRLEATLAHNLDHDFSRWERELRQVAEAEVIANFYGESGSCEYAIMDDPVLKEALSIIKDPQRYAKILTK